MSDTCFSLEAKYALRLTLAIMSDVLRGVVGVIGVIVAILARAAVFQVSATTKALNRVALAIIVAEWRIGCK